MVDEHTLIAALDAGQIAGAGLDTWTRRLEFGFGNMVRASKGEAPWALIGPSIPAIMSANPPATEVRQGLFGAPNSSHKPISGLRWISSFVETLSTYDGSRALNGGGPEGRSMNARSYPVSKWWIGIFYVPAFAFFCYRDWHAIDASASSTAAIAYIYVPFWAAIAALPFAGVGYAAGAVMRAWQSRQRRHVIIASMAAILAVSYLAFEMIETVNDRALAATIARIENLDAAGLATFLGDDKYRANRYALAAVALNPAASSATLARIAAIDDVALHKKFGGPRELMGKNRKGLAVMRLVSRNLNVGSETLALLSRSPDTYVLGDVAMNSATPKAIIERLYLERNRKSDAYLIEWGLAYNKATPEGILRELAGNSRNEYTLRHIGKNPSAPDDVKNLARERIASGAYKQN